MAIKSFKSIFANCCNRYLVSGRWVVKLSCGMETMGVVVVLVVVVESFSEEHKAADNAVSMYASAMALMILSASPAGFPKHMAIGWDVVVVVADCCELEDVTASFRNSDTGGYMISLLLVPCM